MVTSRSLGYDIIERYDAPAGARAAPEREVELAGWFDRHVSARPGALERVRKRVPSAPAEIGRGVKSPQLRSQIRGERFEGCGMERLLAALDACGYEAVISVRPKPAA